MADPKNLSAEERAKQEQAAREEQAKREQAEREQAAREEQARRDQEAANTQNRQVKQADQREQLGGAPHLVRAPDEINPGDVGALAIEQAEQARLAREQRERDELAKTLPQSTLDEMEAGKQALGRKTVAAPQVVTDKA